MDQRKKKKEEKGHADLEQLAESGTEEHRVAHPEAGDDVDLGHREPEPGTGRQSNDGDGGLEAVGEHDLPELRCDSRPLDLGAGRQAGRWIDRVVFSFQSRRQVGFVNVMVCVCV